MRDAPGSMARRLICILGGATFAYRTVAHSSPPRQPPADPLRGEYGFLTQFDVATELDARQTVRKMASAFGIREFQFYDAFEGYSQPPSEGKPRWECAAFGRPVSRSVIEAYTSEIREQGGRAWLYVQAMATAPGDKELQRAAGVAVVGQHVVDGRPLLDAVAPTARWARHFAPRWAGFAASLGFSGIHWDTLGDFRGQNRSMSEAGADLPGFLRAARPLLAERGLAQTANFVDGFGWDPSLLGTGWLHNVVAFPYWEVWTVPEVETLFFQEVPSGGVFVCYPGRGPDHDGEGHNRLQKAVWPLDLLIARWQQARCGRSTYLAIGDGFRHIQGEYFPDTVEVSEDDVAKIRDSVFDAPPACEDHSQKQLLPQWAVPLIWATVALCATSLLAIVVVRTTRERGKTSVFVPSGVRAADLTSPIQLPLRPCGRCPSDN